MTHTETFTFLDPGELVDGELRLVLSDRVPARPEKGYVPVYLFDMHRAGTVETVGTIELRAENAGHIVQYAGHVGYRVFSAYRGHRFAARSLRLLVPLAGRHGIDPLWITCNPENAASRKTNCLKSQPNRVTSW